MEKTDPNKVSMLRYRGSRLKKVKNLDIFTKINEPYKETSSVGGIFSVISFGIILWLIYSEVNYYSNSKFIFKFSPDIDFDEKLKINVDLTVAMPCSTSQPPVPPFSPNEDPQNNSITWERWLNRFENFLIAANINDENRKKAMLLHYADVGHDILDSTSQNAFKFGTLNEEDTWFELSPNQQIHFENKKHFNTYLREEYHAIKDLLWKSSFSTLFSDMPARNNFPDRPYDACRIYGSLILNKVAGNFHITAGKSLNLPRGHVHISAFMTENDYNFTHRINRFSFGDPSPGIVHPLEGDELITNNGMTLFNYFIKVVPTNVKTFLTSVNTYQYSVNLLNRPIDHDKESHGMPGIFFKYDMSALKVTITQERDHLGIFLAKLCSIIGGIYVCSGFLNDFVQCITDSFLCRKNGEPDLKIQTRIHTKKSVIPDVVP